MTRGRRPDGAKRAERCEGSTQAKDRLRWILETLAGRCTVAEACLALAIGERRFHGLVHRFLQGGLNALEPRPAGRPALTAAVPIQPVAQLQESNRDLRIDLRAAQIREEIALTMPHLLRRSEKARAARRARRAARRSSATGAACGDCKRSARDASRARRNADVAIPVNARSGKSNAASAPTLSPSSAGSVSID